MEQVTLYYFPGGEHVDEGDIPLVCRDEVQRQGLQGEEEQGFDESHHVTDLSGSGARQGHVDHLVDTNSKLSHHIPDIDPLLA